MYGYAKSQNGGLSRLYSLMNQGPRSIIIMDSASIHKSEVPLVCLNANRTYITLFAKSILPCLRHALLFEMRS